MWRAIFVANKDEYNNHGGWQWTTRIRRVERTVITVSLILHSVSGVCMSSSSRYTCTLDELTESISSNYNFIVSVLEHIRFFYCAYHINTYFRSATLAVHLQLHRCRWVTHSRLQKLSSGMNSVFLIRQDIMKSRRGQTIHSWPKVPPLSSVEPDKHRTQRRRTARPSVRLSVSHSITVDIITVLYTVGHKKRDTFIFSITQTNIDRFSYFFHCYIQQWIAE